MMTAQLKRLGSAFVFALLITTGTNALAAGTGGGPFGLGIVLGDPSALTVKYWMDRNRALDGGLAFNFDKWVLLYGDWTTHFHGAFGHANSFTSALSPYVGLCGVMVISNKSEAETRREKYFSETSSSKFAFGLRIPLGLEWKPNNLPIGIFAEIAPGLTIVPGTSGFVQGGVGARFFF